MHKCMHTTGPRAGKLLLTQAKPWVKYIHCEKIKKISAYHFSPWTGVYLEWVRCAAVCERDLQLQPSAGPYGPVGRWLSPQIFHMIWTGLREMTVAAGGPSSEQKHNACLQLYHSAFVMDCFSGLLDGHHGLSGLLIFLGANIKSLIRCHQ